jgi:hypothetical protein
MVKIVLGYLLSIIALMAIFCPLTGLTATLAQDDNTPPSDLPSDYSHALTLSVTGKQGVFSFRLPPAVYLNARSADLSDLRVFDAMGGKLPFALYLPTPQNLIKKQSWPVKQFSVNASREQHEPVDAIDLDIKTDADGTLLSVKTKSRKELTGVKPAGNELALAGLVLDLGQTGQAEKLDTKPLISALRFSLPPGRQSYSAQVWLEVSDNLKQWEMIAAAELNWLVDTQTSETLANDRLEFAPRAFRYARLSWKSGEPLRFAGIAAESIEPSAATPSLDKLALQPVAGRKPDDLLYSAGIAIPVEKIDLRFTEPNVVLPAQVGTYRELPGRQLGKPNEWEFQPLTRAVFYQITQSGQSRRSSEMSVPLTHFAEWVVHPQTPTASKPELTLLWQPATLVVLGTGSQPYTLVFGRDNMKLAAADLSQVAPGFSAQELLQLEQAQAGPLQIHQTSADYDSAATTARLSSQTRTLILWSVLFLGVVVLGAMAWHLIKQMKLQ